jgi:hypothetical protein
MDTAWMHWNPNLFGGEGGIEIAVTGRHGGAERRGLIAIHATPSEMAPGTGRAVFF